MTAKTCPKCLEHKEINMFYLSKNKYSSYCKICINKRNRVVHPLFVCKENEKWKEITHLSLQYKISNIGRVLSFKNKYAEKILKERIDTSGYVIYSFSIDGKMKNFKAHRIVATAFIPNPENKPQVNHKNGIKTDNRVENLEWVTGKENTIHAVKNNLIKKAKGERHGMSKLKNEDVLFIRNSLLTNVYLAKIFDISQSNIGNIKNKKTWKNI